MWNNHSVSKFLTLPSFQITKIIKNLRHHKLQSKLKIIETDIKRAELENDKPALELLLAEFNDLSKKLMQS